MDCQRVKAAGTTYRWGIWEALDDGRGLDEGWEPLRRLPVAVARTGYLTRPGDDGTETCLGGGKLEKTFGDPFGLAVTIT